MHELIETDIEKCIEVLHSGGLILYPTDTIWGIGCDATNQQAIDKIFKLKNREDSKAMIIFVKDKNKIDKYANQPSKEIFSYLNSAVNPTTVIYRGAKNLPSNLIGKDLTIGIRIPDDHFCQDLLQNFGKPIVSTSANISGESSPLFFSHISEIIKNGVDYVVQHRRNEIIEKKPSSIISMNEDGSIKIIRP